RNILKRPHLGHLQGSAFDLNRDFAQLRHVLVAVGYHFYWLVRDFQHWFSAEAEPGLLAVRGPVWLRLGPGRNRGDREFDPAFFREIHTLQVELKRNALPG